MVSFAYFASLCLRRQAACSITETARTLHDTRYIVAYRGVSRLVIIWDLTIQISKKLLSHDLKPRMLRQATRQIGLVSGRLIMMQRATAQVVLPLSCASTFLLTSLMAYREPSR